MRPPPTVSCLPIRTLIVRPIGAFERTGFIAATVATIRPISTIALLYKTTGSSEFVAVVCPGLLRDVCQKSGNLKLFYIVIPHIGKLLPLCHPLDQIFVCIVPLTIGHIRKTQFPPVAFLA